jgi:hypothetical protein
MINNHQITQVLSGTTEIGAQVFSFEIVLICSLDLRHTIHLNERMNK